MKISVFGATGFIGSRFCDLYSSFVLPVERDRANPKSNDILYLISTTDNFNPIFKDVETNLLRLSQTLSCLSPGQTFNFVSSWFVYPDDVRLPAREDSVIPIIPLARQGNYSLTKAMAEGLVVSYCEAHDIPYRIFRLANVFGKGDSYSEHKNALQYLINKMASGETIELLGGGNYIRDYIHVDDVCLLLYEGMRNLSINEIYNVGSGRQIVFRDLIMLSHTLLGSKSIIHDVPGYVRDFYMNIDKINEINLGAGSSPFFKLARMIKDEI